MIVNFNIETFGGSAKRRYAELGIAEAKRSGAIRTTSWHFDRLMECKYVYAKHLDETKILSIANQIDSMITILNGCYPDSWDFDIRFDETDSDYMVLYVIIHFPEITIRNSNAKEHIIKDLLVSMVCLEGMESGSLAFDELSGTRCTTTYEEWFSGYVHSHLYSHKPNSFEGAFKGDLFCLGSSEININFDNLTQRYDPLQFELLLLTIGNYVAWESLEGVPYQKLENISSGRSKTSVDSNFSKSNIDITLAAIGIGVNNLKEFPVDFYLDIDRPRIKINEKFDLFIRDILFSSLDLPTTDIHKAVVKKVGTKYHRYGLPSLSTQEEFESKFTNNDGELPFVQFRDRQIPLFVGLYDGGETSIEDYRTYPLILEYAKQKFDTEIYEKLIQRSSYEKQDQADNALRGVAQDPVLV